MHNMPQMQMKRNICLQIQLGPAKRRKIEMCRNGVKVPTSKAIEGVTQTSRQKSLFPGSGGRGSNGLNSHHQELNRCLLMQQPQSHHQQQLQSQLQQHQQQQQQQQQQPQLQQVEEGRLMLESLQGFLIFINKKGKVLYVSDNVEQHLGLKQECLLGKPVLDMVHPGDVKELGKQFVIRLQKSNPNDPTMTSDPVSTSTGNILQSEQKRAFYIRMRFQLSKPGCKTKQSGYVLVQWIGRLKLRTSSRSSGFSVDGLICVCRPVQSQSILEVRLGGNMFMSRHDLDMKFTFCDPRILTLIGYEPCEVIGKTAYYFHYPLDAHKISDCHSNLIVKGSSVSKYYRFFGKNGEWVWMQTRATIIYSTSNDPQYVVCMNYVIGEDEGQRYLMMEEEQKGVHDPNVRGCIDLTNTSTKSPVSSCSSGDESHDDTGYSSSYSHSSPPNSTNMTSPDALSSDERDSVLDDYPMSDVSQTESLNKDEVVSLDQAVTVMSNGFDPFLSSFQTDLGMATSVADDGMDLLDDLLKSMEEEEEQMCQTPKTSTVTVTAPPTVTQSSSGKRQSLLRSLLDKGDNMSCKSFMDYQYSKITSTPDFSPSSSGVKPVSRSESDPTPQKSQPQTLPPVTKLNSFGSTESESATDAQPDPFIPEDLLDFAMQYCETIADEQSQGFMPTYDQDLWSTSMDDLITSLTESQTPSTQSSSTTSAPEQQQKRVQNTRSEDAQVHYVDLDKVNSISKEHRYSCRNENRCESKQSDQSAQKGVSCPSIFSALLTKDISTSPAVCSRFTETRNPNSFKSSSCATTTQTRTMSSPNCPNGQFPRMCSSLFDSEKCHSSSVCRNSPNISNSVCTGTKGGPEMQHKSVSGNKNARNGKTVIQLVSRGGQRIQGSPSPGISATSTSASHRVSYPPATSSETKKAPTPQLLKGMSELEKYLRGYVKRPHAPPQKQGSSCSAALSSSNTPFLQKLLTGELSHEVYREIDSQMVMKERERRSSTSSLSDVIG